MSKPNGSEQILDPQPFGVPTEPATEELWTEIVAQEAPYDEVEEGIRTETILDLWHDNKITNRSFRQRLVGALTAPQEHALPAGCPYFRLTEYMSSPEDSADNLTNYRPALAQELALGVLYWLDYAKSPQGAAIDPYQGGMFEDNPFGIYRNYILGLSKYPMDEEIINRLFAHYSYDDIEPYERDRATGLVMIEDVLFSGDVPPKYKEVWVDKWLAAVEKLRPEDEAKAETAGHWHGAMLNMKRFITEDYTYYRERRQNLDHALYTRVVAFMEENIPTTEAYVRPALALDVAQDISDPEVRFAFLQRHSTATEMYRYDQAPEGTGILFVNSEGHLELARWLLTEAQQRRKPELATKVQAAIQAYEEKSMKPEIITAHEAAAAQRRQRAEGLASRARNM